MSKTFEMKSVDGGKVPIEGGIMSSYARDTAELQRLGKVPVLKRNFGFMSMLAFSCTVMITWEAVLFLFLISFENGGSAGSVYGYLLAFVGTLSVFATMGELSSMLPTAGGQYHWVAVLAPKPARKFLSYFIGWLTIAGWQAVVASGGYICATMLQGLAVLGNTGYEPKAWQGTLLLWAVIFFAVVVNTVVSRALPQIESLIMVLHILGFAGILIPLVYKAEYSSASDVFTVFLNEGGWETQGLSFFVGLIGPVFAFGGADGAIHMCEEIKNASVVVPRAMVWSIFINGILGFGMLLGILFCLGDLDTILETPTGYPFMAIFLQSTQSQSGALTMVSIIVILAILATISWVASASRMLWSFARDRGVPGWEYIGKVDQRTTIPIIAIFVTTVIACLLGLINIGSAVAFNDVVALTITGLYSSYFIGNMLLLWHRIRGNIHEHISADDRDFSAIDAETHTWGPWKIPEPFGTINNIFGNVFLVIVLFFSYWPTAFGPTAKTMNYNILLEGSVLLGAIVYYIFWARKSYAGPVIEISLDEVRR